MTDPPKTLRRQNANSFYHIRSSTLNQPKPLICILYTGVMNDIIPSRSRRRLKSLALASTITVLCVNILVHSSYFHRISSTATALSESDAAETSSNTTRSDETINHQRRVSDIDPTVLFRDIRYSKDENGTTIASQADDWSTKRDDETTTTARTTRKKKKPWCIFHVGPPKTATTAIQQDFTAFSDQQYLARDNYTYSGLCWRNGRFCHRGAFLVALNQLIALPNKICLQKLVLARQEYYNRNNNITTTTSSHDLYKVLYAVDCPEFQRLVDMLHDLHSRGGMSLFVSEEQMSYTLDKYSRVWNLLQDILQDSWHFGILVGYRRWMDYLPSRHWQDEVNKRGTYNWIGNGENTSFAGRHVDPLFPAQHGVEKLGKFTDSVLTKLKRPHPTNLPIRIFNMNAAAASQHSSSSLSLRSILFCHVIPHMDNCCQQSLLLDSSSISSSNKQLSVGVGGVVVGAAKTFDYDMLTVAAKAAGLLHPGLERQNVTNAAREFHKKSLSLSSSSSTTTSSSSSDDFAQICPSQQEMETFLNISLAKERVVMPELHAHPLFGQDQHREKFWKAVQQKKYCTIDTNATLQQVEWRQFFANLQP
jgi:hypothetical protein